MIKINLLPDKPKETKAGGALRLASVPVIPLFSVLLGLLILIYAVLSVGVISKKIALVRLKDKWERMAEMRAEVEPIKNEIRRIAARNDIVKAIADNRILWSEKLERISLDIADGLWLKHLKVENENGLNLSGSAVNIGGKGATFVSEFIKKLTRDKAFMRGLSEVKPGPINKRKIKYTDVMDFEVICPFKD